MMHDVQEQDLTIQVPITTAMRAQAEALAGRQPTAEKSEQIYRNTMAVLVVNAYLGWQGYETDLSQSNNWNLGTLAAGGDVADLMIKDLGRLECRAVLQGATVCPLPPEVWHGRIGYVVVQFDVAVDKAVLLGFKPIFDPEDPMEEVPLDELQSLDELIDYLDRLERGNTQLENAPSLEAEQVRQMWVDPYSRLMVVAQLERIYRTESRSKWRVKAEKVLSGRILEGALVREEAVLDDRIALQGLAERLLEQLATVWGSENAG
ncbi:DUF1822 family protein [Trichocoleus sp. FACHB-591]|uniref:DUF1822 family protein n=1 Tax=Trichocoleus sp. FACHB-591 TaxID=2692872 RepID=UPI0016840A0D|nr:DUF1822 family protein [Trichocoleus sp. FACHB-591]MBD2094456.1 DUF1822 family protein [Trichocoleus sp. FACHB-591]